MSIVRESVFTLGLWLVAFSSHGYAFSNFPETFCDTYPQSPHCTKVVGCEMCHSSSSGGPRNGYGSCLQAAGASTNLGEALAAAENQDCDGDGTDSITEILRGTFPGAADPLKPEPVEVCSKALSEENGWNVCGYDANHVYRKVHRDFCGQTPSFADFTAFKGLAEPELKKQRIHELLDQCLKSSYWRGADGPVWQIGYYKIGPMRVIKSGPNGGSIPLGDYEDDQNLFAFHHLDDNDIRGVLLADYFVQREDGSSVKYIPVSNLPAHTINPGLESAVGYLKGTKDRQHIVPAHRAGVMTTSYGFARSVMFTSVNRGMAALYLK